LLGIIFTGGECPSSDVIRRELDGKDAFIVAADCGLIAAENAGIRPALIVGDMDSLGDNSRLGAYPPQNVKSCDSVNKDYSDTELAFAEAVKKGCDEIWIIGGGGGRIDHLLAIRALFERDPFPFRWLTNSADIYCISARTQRAVLSRSLGKNAPVSVFPLGEGAWEAKSEGLKWKLEGLSWDRGFFGLSNIAENGSFTVTAEKGRFMVILAM
jgi:thiamine pyrophosphokinase